MEERRRYFLDRAEVRFEIGAGVAALLALTGLYTQFYAALFLLASVLTLWTGWRLTEGTLRQMEPGPDLNRIWKRRYRGLLVAEILQIWMALSIVWLQSGLLNQWLMTQPGQLFKQLSNDGLAQYLLGVRYSGLPGLDATLAIRLLPVPVMVLVLQGLLRRKAGQSAALLAKPVAIFLAVLYGLFIVTVLWRYMTVLPLVEQISEVNVVGGMKQAKLEAQLADANAPFLLAEWLLAAGTAAAPLATTRGRRIRKKAVGTLAKNFEK